MRKFLSLPAVVVLLLLSTIAPWLKSPGFIRKTLGTFNYYPALIFKSIDNGITVLAGMVVLLLIHGSQSPRKLKSFFSVTVN